MTPDRLDHTRKHLIADIRKAFQGVTREGGISWSETAVMDDYGNMRQRKSARERDQEASWWDLVHDSQWDPEAYGCGFSYLDPIGFRYYLPAAMVRCINDGTSERLSYALEVENPRIQDHTLTQCSLLNRDQRRCVIRFLKYMSEADKELGNDKWQQALDSYWSTALDP